MLDDEEEKGIQITTMATMGYTRHYNYKKLHDPNEQLELDPLPSNPADKASQDPLSAEELHQRGFFARYSRNPFAIMALISALFLTVAIIGLVRSAVLEPRATDTASSTNVPQYFQTTPELFAGKTPTFK